MQGILFDMNVGISELHRRSNEMITSVVALETCTKKWVKRGGNKDETKSCGGVKAEYSAAGERTIHEKFL